MKKNAVEILAPAGSYESMTAAFNAGADAAYIGGSRFGARAFADNLGEDQMLRAIDYAHLHGRRLYMTVNTLMKDAEMEELYGYLLPYWRAGLDAVIVQDLGVFSFVKKYFPGLPVHASTQMTVTGAEGALLLASMGAERVVTARELSLSEIARIHRESDVEIESFVHGALCYCYSGQCLLSSVIGGRSGNRGRCAQPCRLPYEVRQDGKTINRRDERYVMSLKDLCTLDILPDILEAGVCSLKIEGRMKSPRYTAGVVSIYRKYVDQYLQNDRRGYRVDPADRRMLLDLFDRGGFTEGYYREHNGRDMVALKEKPAFREGNEKLFEMLDKTYVNAELKEPASGAMRLAEGEPMRLVLECGGHGAEVTGRAPEKAQSRPVTVESVEKQMKKTGNTPFRLESLKVELEGKLFVPVQELNDLRRRGTEALAEAITGAFRRSEANLPEFDCGAAEDAAPDGPWRPRLAASVWDLRLLPILLETEDISEIYLDSTDIGAEDWKAAAGACHEAGRSCFLRMPQIFRQEARDYFAAREKELFSAGFDGLVVGSLEEIGFLREISGRGGSAGPFPLIFDHNLYGFNRLAAKENEVLGAFRQTFPLELNAKELLRMGGSGRELVVYGRAPVMVSAQCMKKTAKGCDRRPETLTLRDRMGKEFPVRNHCRFCYNTIYNTSPLSLLTEKKTLEQLKPAVLRLEFTVESAGEVRQAVKAFGDQYLRGLPAKQPSEGMTRGHFKRGVE